MKYKLILVIYMIFLCSSVAIGDTGLEKNAQKLVAQYLTALVQGNTELLLDILGGDLLESRRTLLQNPDYSTYLADAYVDANVSVTGSRQLSDSSVAVDVVIEKSIDEQFGLIFLVEFDKDKGKKLLIVSEQEAEKK